MRRFRALAGRPELPLALLRTSYKVRLIRGEWLANCGMAQKQGLPATIFHSLSMIKGGRRLG